MSKSRVWSRFSRNVNGSEVKFRIQEVGSKHYEDVLNLYMTYYSTEEPVHKAANVLENEETIKEYKEHYLGHAFSDELQIDVCCLDDDSEELRIVAGSIMYVDVKNESLWDGATMLSLVNTKQMKTFFLMVNHMTNRYYKDFRAKLDLNLFYDDVGIVVHPGFRGLGLAGEMFKARELTCKEQGIQATGAWMTSIGSQKAATKLGWKNVLEITYEDLGKIGGVTYGESAPSAIYMIKSL